MAQELGKVEKPPVGEFAKVKRLFFVPLVFLPDELPADLTELVNRYWDQVEAQIANLEEKLGKVSKIYHELIPVGGEQGCTVIEELGTGSYRAIKARVDSGAELQPLEDGQLLIEVMDWSKCLSAGLQSEMVFDRVYESYLEAHSKRNEHIRKQINETLSTEETGMLLMREGHQIQFASDIQVFYIAPPGLDEIRRWFRSHASEPQTQTDNTLNQG